MLAQHCINLLTIQALINLFSCMGILEAATSSNARFPGVRSRNRNRNIMAGGVDPTRSSKFFPLFSIVRITNNPCIPELPDSVGTCFTRSQCTNARGLVSGSCAAGFGVCCVVIAACDSVVNQNNTIFRNRDFPSTIRPTSLEVCTIRVQKPSANVCQLHLNFTDMKLAGTNDQGQCLVDQLTINGVTSAPPNLCGTLTGQHMYLDFGSNDRITLSVIIDGAANGDLRSWNVKMKYIECLSPNRAPEGCLQYFTSASEEVRILGYPMIPHLADLDYTVCVRNTDDAGSIVWTPCQGEPTPLSFAMTGDATAAAAVGTTCPTDYILLMTDDPAVPITKMDDRYCGTSLIDPMLTSQLVRSVAHPFLMRVRTDSTEVVMMDVTNSGFCLSYRQEPPSRG